MNFPASHPSHQGCQWNGGGQSPALAEANVVLVIDSDVPWIPKENNPAKGARIFHIDVDPLKEQMPLFYIPAQRRYKADAEIALTQILEHLEDKDIETAEVKNRLKYLSARHQKRIERLDRLETIGSGSAITTPILMGVFRKVAPGDSTLMIEVFHFALFLTTGYHSVRTLFRPFPLRYPWAGIRFWRRQSRMGFGCFDRRTSSPE